MDKKVRKAREFANIRYNDKITENPKNDVFAKNNAEFEIQPKFVKKGSVKEGDIDMSKKTKITEKA